jgi:hypothetical protein
MTYDDEKLYRLPNGDLITETDLWRGLVDWDAPVTNEQLAKEYDSFVCSRSRGLMERGKC